MQPQNETTRRFTYLVESQDPIQRLDAHFTEQKLKGFLDREQYNPVISPHTYDDGDRYFDASIKVSREITPEHQEKIRKEMGLKIQPQYPTRA